MFGLGALASHCCLVILYGANIGHEDGNTPVPHVQGRVEHSWESRIPTIRQQIGEIDTAFIYVQSISMTKYPFGPGSTGQALFIVRSRGLKWLSGDLSHPALWNLRFRVTE